MSRDATDLQGVGVERAVETGATHVDLSGDLRTAQNHVFEAGLVLPVGRHEQRALDPQGVGVELPSKLAPVMSICPAISIRRRRSLEAIPMGGIVTS